MKKFTRILVLLIAVLSFCFVVSAVEVQKGVDAAGTVNIFVLNTGDIHECSKYLQKIESSVNQIRNDPKNAGRVILVDAGDMLTQIDGARGYPASQDWAGQNDRMYKWASSMNYNAMIFGNHDFVGVGGVAFLQKYPNLPFICANLEYPKQEDHTNYLGADGIIPPYKIIKLKDGITVGIIGIADQNKKDYHFPKDSHGKSPDKEKLTAFRVNDDCVKDAIKEVKSKSPDFIVILSHNNDNIDAKYVTALGIDKPLIIIGGHSHKVIPEKKKLRLPKGCYVIKSGLEGEYLGMTTITWDPGKHKITKVTVKNTSMK